MSDAGLPDHLVSNDRLGMFCFLISPGWLTRYTRARARFMIADPLFTLAMALNVYLTFFRRYSAEQLRSMEWKYLIMCYGLPFPPALTYFFVRNSSGVRVYGPATVGEEFHPTLVFHRGDRTLTSKGSSGAGCLRNGTSCVSSASMGPSGKSVLWPPSAGRKLGPGSVMN